jgi:hypothetical protein
MPMSEDLRTCPHCGSQLKKMRVPPETAWGTEFVLVCFNDACSYYEGGWKWMKEAYNQRVSYRYMFNPTTNASSMIPVWSADATRDLIVEDSAGDEG